MHETVAKKKRCAFTIVSRNYLHFARTLMESLRVASPDVTRIVCLCDSRDEINDIPDGLFEIMDVMQLDIPDIPDFLMQYTCIEANTAIKPFVFESLFKQGYEEVIYFDPDIRIYNPIDEMLHLLDQHDVILTPHLTGSIDDDKFPDEVTFLQSGTYNLGYLALKRTPNTHKLLTWWQTRLMHDCVIDIPRGVFVDQKWMNLAPSLFENVYICRNPGWNTAYWNLNHRDVSKGDSGITVNGEPLLFFHFSGISPDAKVFSKHQNRFSMDNLNSVIQKLATDYCAALTANGATGYGKMEYAFGNFSGGTPIPDFIRRIYRENRDLVDKLGNPLTTAGELAWLSYANNIAPGFHIISCAALAFYESRRDLLEAFPDISAGGEQEYAHWFVNHGLEQPGMSEEFVTPIRERLRAYEKPTLSSLIKQSPIKSIRQLSVWASRRIYKLLWTLRKLAYPFTSHAFRQKLNKSMVKNAYGRTTRKTSDTKLEVLTPIGLNVIGYIRAESGVGRACRLTLDAVKRSKIPTAITDFSTGCASRTEVKLAHDFAEGQKFDINLFHINADQMPVIHSQLGDSIFNGAYNIGFWFWELPEFPDEWLSSFDNLDEIWVASTFCQQAIAAKSPIPVTVMHPGITVDVDTDLDRSHFGLPNDKYIFLTMADGLSYPQRKNPLGAINAYLSAFPDSDRSTALVVKLINTEHNSATIDKIREIADSDSSIYLLEKNMDTTEVGALMNCVDCLVSLHRSEGFGLPLAEAMYLGKPVIGTGWSSNMNFMTAQNSYLVNYELVKIESDIGPYKAGQIWADPDVEHASSCMRNAVNDLIATKAKAQKGQADIVQYFSPKAAGKCISKRLEVIRLNIK